MSDRDVMLRLREMEASLRDREAECERLKAEKDGIIAAFHLVADRAELAEAKLSAMVEAARPILEDNAEQLDPFYLDSDVTYITTGQLRALKAASENATGNGGDPK